MVSYYNRVDGNLHPGDIAKAEDINDIQTNIDSAIRSVINDHHEFNSYIYGGKENAFQLTPAPKRFGRYIDTMNVFDESQYKWLSINHTGYIQGIKKSKSSLYSVICKFRNKNDKPITVMCTLFGPDRSEDNCITTKIEIPGQTDSAEFEIVFDWEHVSTAPGLSHNDVERFDTDKMAPPMDKESFDQGPVFDDKKSLNNFTIGATQLYLQIHPLNISEQQTSPDGTKYQSVHEDDFQILADLNGSYGKLLEESKNGLINWENTAWDLYFKDVYATNATYLCEMGEAIIDGERVKLNDTHVSVSGASSFGHVKSFVYMDNKGLLHSVNSPAFFNENTDTAATFIPGPHLVIAEITTYRGNNKPSFINQDDTTLRIRRRSHEERLRRLEKELNYVKDVAIPPRLKYSLSGEDIVDKEPERGRNSIWYEGKPNADGTKNAKLIEGGEFFLTTDSQGNFVIKSVDAEVVTIPITLQGETSTKDVTGVELVKRIAENTNMVIDSKEGTLKLKTKGVEGSGVGLTDEEAKKTTLNIWDDDSSNRPKDKNIKPTEREYKVVKGKNGEKDFDSEFPAMTFYTDKDYKLEGMHIPITKFKNCESIKFIIWKRQGPNDKDNEVWFEKKMYTSESFSLKDAKEKDSYQIMEDGFTIKISDGLSLPKGQYVIVCFHTPKDDTGSCFVETYKPDSPKDFCIRYYGAADGSHFLLKERYHEIWYNSATFTGTSTNYEPDGSIVSGTVEWNGEDPIDSILVNANITTPEKCSYKILADTGDGWKELTVDKAVTMTGGGSSFRWKVEFKGDGDSPVLAYDKDKKYALNFIITRAASKVGSLSTIESNNCITTKVLRADDILREYIGDPNFAYEGTRFSNYEFARIWGSDFDSNKMIIDIEAADRQAKLDTDEIITTDGTIPKQSSIFDIFSLIYCDLDLDDFNTYSVDYSHYDSQVEYDEHNLRLKLDTENSYNDNSIALFRIDDLKAMPNDIGTASDDGKSVTIAPNASIKTNQTLFKLKEENHGINLTKHSGIRIGLKVTGPDKKTLKGLGLYLSSAFEDETPQNNVDESMIVLKGTDGFLDDLNKPVEEIVKYYYGKIIRVIEEKNGVYYTDDYHYVKQKDGSYLFERIQNENSFHIYRFPTLSPSDDTQYVEISIDSTAYALQNVRELGIITMNGEKDADNKDAFITQGSWNIEIVNIRSIEEDYYSIYDPQRGDIFKKTDPGVANQGNGKYSITMHEQSNELTSQEPQKVTDIKIRYNVISSLGETIGYWSNTSTAKNFKHIGIQIAADCWIPKNALRLNLCSDAIGQQVIYSMDIPTLNYIHYPAKANSKKQVEYQEEVTKEDGTTETVTKTKTETLLGYVNLSQAFKKIKNVETEVKSISISCTSNFKNFMYKLKENPSTTDAIHIYIGKITLYKAETIPIFHKNIRYKVYNQSTSDNADAPTLRKIGAVLNYQ